MSDLYNYEKILSGCVDKYLELTTKNITLQYGKGIYLYDVNNKKYIDAMSGAWVVNIGHGNMKVVNAGYEQGQKLSFILQEGYQNIPSLELTDKLCSLSSPNLQRIFYTCGGSEAIDSAMKLVRQYWLEVSGKSRYKVIGRKNSYHGATFGAMSVSGLPNWKTLFRPYLPGCRSVPHPYCYRCEFDLEYPQCSCKCVEETERIIQSEDPETIGAFVAEPICMSIGTAIPPKEYWKAIREICNKYNILLIADEIVTAFGRIGKWFGLQNWDVEPDIMTIGKGLTSGYAPLAAVVCKNNIADTVKKRGFVHGFTYSAHPVSSAIALKNIEIIEADGLCENALIMGKYLDNELHEQLASFPIVGDIRCYGLLATIEIVANKETKVLLKGHNSTFNLLKRKLLDNGIICRVTNMIFLGPPLCITKQEIDELVGKIKKALGEFWMDYYDRENL